MLEDSFTQNVARRKIILNIVIFPLMRRQAIKVSPSITTAYLFETVCKLLEPTFFAFALFRQKNRKDEIINSEKKTIGNFGLTNGDFVFVEPTHGKPLPSTSATSLHSNSCFTSNTKINRKVTYQEDDVDAILANLDGKIKRSRNFLLCNHNFDSFCVYCLPYETYDEAYLRYCKINHMSYHAYLRKLTSGANREKIVELDDDYVHIKPKSEDYLPRPAEPNAFTLSHQTYRHVDNVQFQSVCLLKRFLYFWRDTGFQRAGLLYGYYKVNPNVPLGITAIVTAIYEPPQDTNEDFITILPDDREEIVNEIAARLGMRRIGYIFTDLICDDTQLTIKHVRDAKSYFLSTQECITCAIFQSLHPNPSGLSSSGYHGSKFVTICVSSDENGKSHINGYQVSNQCMNLVRDNCLRPVFNHPELAYIRGPFEEQCTSEIFIRDKDSSGNERVFKISQPIPNNYLLVNIPYSISSKPHNGFNSDVTKDCFPIENRTIPGQSVNDLVRYFDQFTNDQFLVAISDFHLLIFLATMEALPMKDHMAPLLEAIKHQDALAALRWSQSKYWASVLTLITTTKNNNNSI